MLKKKKKLRYGQHQKKSPRQSLPRLAMSPLEQTQDVANISQSAFFNSPSLSMSCSFDNLNQELIAFMDKMDVDSDMSINEQQALCSTPAAGQKTSRSVNHNSFSLLSSEFSPTPEKRPKTQSALITTTPLTSRRESISVLSTPNHSSHLQLSQWGLPEKVLQRYSTRGVTTLFPWQAECLSLRGILNGRNLIYSAPTSAGKTLVAELLALKCVLEQRKKVVIILPLVSIAQEKTASLKELFEPIGIKIGGFMGGHSPQGGFAAVDVAICTIEKANSLINHLLEEGKSEQLGAIVVDELHMIGDHHRGYLLELLLTKLLYVHHKADLKTATTQKTEEEVSKKLLQIIGMSATLPNLETLATWLNAALYCTDYRPVPLKEMIKIGRVLYDTNFKEIKSYEDNTTHQEGDEDILAVCHERLSEGHSVIIFCPTKSWCEKLASNIATASFLCQQDQSQEGKLIKLNNLALSGVCEQLKRTPSGLDRVLRKTVPAGVAFHHAGLTRDEREIIEGAFRQYHIKILAATSTLSAGVNLPARLVVIRTPVFHQSIMDITVYKQMVGRAGRKGVDQEGESILMCKPSERQKVTAMLKSAPKPVKSCLGQSSITQIKRGGTSKSKTSDHLLSLTRAVLEVIASGTASNRAEVDAYISCSLLHTEIVNSLSQSEESEDASKHIQDSLTFLLENEFIALRKKPSLPFQETKENIREEIEQYYPTQLGSATMSSALSPTEALVVFAELLRARKAFVLENELHLIYLVTPVYIQDQWPSIDWYRFLCLWERLPPDMKHVAKIIGVQEAFLAQAVQGRVLGRTLAQQQRLQVHQRFLTALALHDLVREAPLPMVASKYNASKGLLQNLQSAAGTFAGMVTVFCGRLGWKNMELLFDQFQSRLAFGIERELCDLVLISVLNGSRARALYNAGFHTLPAIATANPVSIESCLRKAFPFQSSKDGESVPISWCSKLRKGMTESELAELIVIEARHILSEQMGIPEAVWSKNMSSSKQLSVMGPPSISLPVGHKAKMSQHINDEQHKMIAIGKPESPYADKPPSSIAALPQLVDQGTPMVAKDASPIFSSITESPVAHLGNSSKQVSLFRKLTSPNVSVTDTTSDLSMSFNTQALAEIDACVEHCQLADQNSLEPLAHTTYSSTSVSESSPQFTPEDKMAGLDIKELSSMCCSMVSESGMSIIDVTANQTLFETFLVECLEQKSLSFSVAVESAKDRGIGMTTRSNLIKRSKGIRLEHDNQMVLGVALCWSGQDVYYVSLCEQQSSCDDDLSVSQLGLRPNIDLSSRIDALRQIFTSQGQAMMITAYDVKKQTRLLMSATGLELGCSAKVCDPIVADWMLDPSNKTKTLHNMQLQYLTEQPNLHVGKDSNDIPLSSLATHSSSTSLKASAESILANLLMEQLLVLLQSENLCDSFFTVEMPAQLTLAKIELNGIGFSVDECNNIRDALKSHLTELEHLAYGHAGKTFSLTSPDDVSHVLFLELKLPSGQDKQMVKTLGVSGRRSKKRVQHLSTAKGVLEKIRHLHPLPGIILEWRRVSNTVSKTVYPLFKEAVSHEKLNSTRIHSTCQLHTATGRIAFTDPNLQSIPNEYQIGLHTINDDQNSYQLLPEFDIFDEEIAEKADNVQVVCMRNVFVSLPGTVFLAADYSQLELRILAHMSGDSKLQHILNSEGDAFKLIAGEWLGISAAKVTSSQRQQTKHICYGMIYGIGSKALAEQLSVTNEEAVHFMESFKDKYPQMRSFIASTVQKCRENGYITTIKGRRRYLPGIHSSEIHARLQAERQAVNSTIQGSAADLAKLAMINIDKKLTGSKVTTFLSNGLPTAPSELVLLVLQLHDELLYEVSECMLDKVAHVVKSEMELAMNLSVKLPVKLKSGKSWGNMTTYSCK